MNTFKKIVGFIAYGTGGVISYLLSLLISMAPLLVLDEHYSWAWWVFSLVIFAYYMIESFIPFSNIVLEAIAMIWGLVIVLQNEIWIVTVVLFFIAFAIWAIKLLLMIISIIYDVITR